MQCHPKEYELRYFCSRYDCFVSSLITQIQFQSKMLANIKLSLFECRKLGENVVFLSVSLWVFVNFDCFHVVMRLFWSKNGIQRAIISVFMKKKVFLVFWGILHIISLNRTGCPKVFSIVSHMLFNTSALLCTIQSCEDNSIPVSYTHLTLPTKA